MALLGTPVPRVEDARFLVGATRYVADLDLPGVLTVTYVTSPLAHAEVGAIDVTAARGVPGVVDVVTAADVDLGPLPALNPAYPEAMLRPLLATGRVRFVGEPVAAIVAETDTAGADAAALVEVDYEPLPVVVDPEAAAGDERLLFPDAGTNVVMRQQGGQRRTPIPPATAPSWSGGGSSISASPRRRSRAGRARPGGSENGRLTHWSSCQGAHPVRAVIASLYGLPRRPGAGDRPRRGRQLRGQSPPLPRGAAAALAGPAGRPAGALGVLPVRRHAGARPRPGSDPERSRSPADRDGTIASVIGAHPFRRRRLPPRRARYWRPTPAGSSAAPIAYLP